MRRLPSYRVQAISKPWTKPLLLFKFGSLRLYLYRPCLLCGTLTPWNVFTTLTLLNIVQFTVTKHFLIAVMGLSECFVSRQRIQAFLELPERPSIPSSGKSSDHSQDGPERWEVLSLIFGKWTDEPATEQVRRFEKIQVILNCTSPASYPPEILKMVWYDLGSHNRSGHFGNRMSPV
jgi:hypothetical protein